MSKHILAEEQPKRRVVGEEGLGVWEYRESYGRYWEVEPWPIYRKA